MGQEVGGETMTSHGRARQGAALVGVVFALSAGLMGTTAWSAETPEDAAQLAAESWLIVGGRG